MCLSFYSNDQNGSQPPLLKPLTPLRGTWREWLCRMCPSLRPDWSCCLRAPPDLFYPAEPPCSPPKCHHYSAWPPKPDTTGTSDLLPSASSVIPTTLTGAPSGTRPPGSLISDPSPLLWPLRGLSPPPGDERDCVPSTRLELQGQEIVTAFFVGWQINAH